MKTRSSKRFSQSPVREEDEVSNPNKRSGAKKQKLVTKKTKNGNASILAKNKPNFVNKDLKIKSDSSDSSSDEYLRPPQSLDLNSDYFNIKKEETNSEFSLIENNIFDGIQRLSESEDSEFEEVNSDKCNLNGVEKSTHKIELPIGMHSKTKPMNSNFEQRSSEKRSNRKKGIVKPRKSKVRTSIKDKGSSSSVTKDKLKVKSTNPCLGAPEVNNMDVSQLLALGEGPSEKELAVVSLTSESENELSDWEEVKGEDAKSVPVQHTVPKEGVEVTLEMPELYRKRKKKGFDMEAFMKRRVNQAKRAFQVLIHKVNLLCWIGHGFHVNSVLNSEVLMGISLSLIPSQHCYPKGRTNISYLEQILKWFIRTVPVQEEVSDNKGVSLHESLIKQFENSLSKSKHDLVYMFICLLRSLGVTARLVISLQPLPLRPERHELCSLQPKKESNSTKKSKSNGDVCHIKKDKQKEGKVKSSPKKKDSKELAVGDVIRKNRNVMSKEEAIERIKLSNEQKLKEKVKGVKNAPIVGNNKELSHKPNSKNKSEKQIENQGKSRRGLRIRGGKINKYKENSDSCDDEVTISSSSSITNKNDGQSKSVKGLVESKKNIPDSTMNSIKKSNSSQTQKKGSKVNDSVTNVNKNNISLHNHDESDGDFLPEPSTSQQKKTVKSRRSNKITVKEEHDSDFELESVYFKNSNSNRNGNAKKVIDRRVLSTDSSDGDRDKKKKIGIDVWTEVFLESEETWMSVDVPRGKVHCANELYSRATHPVTYVLAWNPDLSLKDVTRRYCSQFHTVTRKHRVDEVWWEETVAPFLGRRTARDREEDDDLDRQLQDRPLPKTVSEYKNHPLYVLKKDLLKFEAIYPPDAPTLGFIRGEGVYARECVRSLHSREIWVKEAKVVRLGEQPYKIVKARPKYDRMTGQMLSNLPLELFGDWQVEDYVPPAAVDGKVPRNPYGNVELFKPCMLPKGTVHLQVPGLNRVARKLNIDCASAMIGFDYHCGGSHPVYDGYVVCEEFKDTIMDAWTQEQEESEKRRQDKLDKRVYGNWRRLIKGLLIREKLQERYSFGDGAGPSGNKSTKSKQLKVSKKKRKIESGDDSDWVTD